MIPIRLEIEGLYSYQGKQHIDFERLTAAQLFGIFGATGSGKSSILEAITFALYGRSERLSGRVSGGAAYQMMNLKSNKLYIDFEFRAGRADHDRYRITVEGRRHKKQFEKIQSFQRSAYQWKGEQWQPMEWEDATGVVGLSYENFRRTIIIPQGRFEEFIQLRSKDRSQMLQDIFGLRKYDLSRQTKSLIRKNQLRMENRRALLQQYGGVTQEAIEAEKQQIAALEAQHRELSRQLAEQQKAYEQQQLLKSQFETLQQTQAEWDSLQALQPEMEARAQRLETYLLALESFSITLNKRKEKAAQLESLQQELQRDRATFADMEAELKTLGLTFQSIEAAFQQREELLKEVAELEQVVRLKELEGVIEKLEQRVGDGRGVVEQLEREIKQQEQQLQAQQQQVQRLRRDLPDAQELLAIREWYAVQQQLSERLSWVEQQREGLEEKIAQARREKQALLRQTSLDPRQYELPSARLVELLQEEMAQKKQQKEELEARKQQLLHQQQLLALAGELRPGEACPLCGATEHPAPAQSAGQQQALLKVQQQLQAAAAQLETLGALLPQLRQLARQARSLAEELQQQKQEAAALHARMEQHKARFVWEQFQQKDDAAFQRQIERMQQESAKIENREQQIAALQAALTEKRDKVQRYRQSLEKLLLEKSSRSGEWLAAKKALSKCNYDELSQLPDEELLQRATALKKQHEETAILYAETAAQLKEKKARLDVLKGKIEAAAQQQQLATRQLAVIQQELQGQLEQSGFESLEEVETTLAQALNIQAEKDALREFEQQRTQVHTTLAHLHKQLAGQSFEPQLFEQLRAKIEEATQRQTHLAQEAGAKKAYMNRLLTELEKKQRLQQEMKQLELRAENLRLMENMFRANGFVNYVSTVYLQNLCAAANVRFMRLTRNSLSLEVDDQNNFHVRDLLHGGRQRSIKTLSGGQTFQAALCLALALSEQVQQQVQARQNFFFLDEGFGSLDKESVQVVFQTLKALRQEKRIVGIISHVEMLQEEIDTWLWVVNHPENGSKVQGSWEE